jgi:hypothetical protein
MKHPIRAKEMGLRWLTAHVLPLALLTFCTMTAK